MEARPALLLLGCSRMRYLYHSQVSSCSDDPYNWQWAAPARSQPPHQRNLSIVWRGRTYQNAEMSAGALCRAGAPLAALAYLSHYGVSPDRVYFSPWRYHLHEGWGEAQPADSAALSVEALRRFARRAPAGASVVVVYASLVWDLARRDEHFATQPHGAWAREFAANYSALTRELRAQLPPTAAALLLALEYEVSPALQWWGQPAEMPRVSPQLPHLWQLAMGAALRQARALRAHIVPLLPNVSKLGARRMLRADGLHPTAAACEMVWSSICFGVARALNWADPLSARWAWGNGRAPWGAPKLRRLDTTVGRGCERPALP
ncbi:hypothetical protein AB1Y20_020354 [Prymnesium parvum]|uniref:SGNH hydrolase-type esterase domain-containing protein n=1 Tax=Prymnesium parvum TaxID=97485 RepID=A0AB34JT62_PRYPA